VGCVLLSHKERKNIRQEVDWQKLTGREEKKTVNIKKNRDIGYATSQILLIHKSRGCVSFTGTTDQAVSILCTSAISY